MRQAAFKRYLTGLALLVGGGIGLLALFNFVVNPFNLYAGPRISGFNDYKYELAKHSRLSKAAEVRRLKPDCLILGSSRAQVGLDPGHPGWSGCARAYNLSHLGGTLYEARRYLQDAEYFTKPRVIVLAVDFLMFNVYRPSQQPGFLEMRMVTRADGQSNPEWRSVYLQELMSGLISHQTAAASWSTIFPSYRRRMAGPEDGFWEYTREDSDAIARYGQREIFLGNEESFMTRHWFPAPRHRFRAHDAQTGVDSFDDLRAMLRLAHRNKASFLLHISPAHARQWEALAQAGLWTQWEEWKRMLVQVNDEEARRAGRAAFPLWDFSGFNSYTTEAVPPPGDRKNEMRWYRESSHYRKELGDRVLDVVLGTYSRERDVARDFGVRLDAHSIENHLAATRAARVRWRAQYPQDVAEIAELARRTANWRQP